MSSKTYTKQRVRHLHPRANETLEQRKLRLANNRIFFREYRANETPEKRESRLAKMRIYNREYRARLRAINLCP